MFKKDTIYKGNFNTPVYDFSFDEKVAEVFPDMIKRSIPGYATLLTIIQAIFRSHFKDRSNLRVYDLGCSVGGVTMALLRVMPSDTSFFCIDLSETMLAKARIVYKDICSQKDNIPLCKFYKEDMVNYDLLRCNAVCINFTLQFLKKGDRDIVLKKVFNALDKNGILFVAEKVKDSDAKVRWHEQFKKNMGYSDLEIAKKRTAIENVMLIDTKEEFERRLASTGFKFERVFQALSFCGWICKK